MPAATEPEVTNTTSFPCRLRNAISSVSQRIRSRSNPSPTRVSKALPILITHRLVLTICSCGVVTCYPLSRSASSAALSASITACSASLISSR